ncbi:Ionotropic receptor 338 [Blattella germanica]|nr:Ionotropic receptor 338 [Blattella germanica]
MHPKIFLILFVCSFLLKLSRNEEFELSMAECLVHVVIKYFDTHLPVLIYTHGTNFPIGDKVIQIVHNKINFSQIIFSNTVSLLVRFRTRIKPGSYIVMVPPVESTEDVEFIKGMFRKIRDEAFNPRGKVVFVNFWMEYNTVNDLSITHYLLNLALSFGFVDAVVLDQRILDEKSKELRIHKTNISVFTWTINEQLNICSRFIDKMTHEDTWISMERKFELQSRFFKYSNKIDMKHCVLQVSLQNYPPFVFNTTKERTGPIVAFIMIVCKSINATCKLIDWSHSSEGVDVHLIFPAIYGIVDPYPNTWRTYPHMRTDIAWFVPSGQKQHSWRSLYRTFSPIVWVFILIIFSFGSVTMWLLQTSHRLLTGRNSYSDIAFSALLMHLGMSVSAKFKGFVATMFFTLWFCYCLIINTAYQSAYFGILVYPGNMAPIKSVKELEESGLVMERNLNVYGKSSDWDNIMQYRGCAEKSSDLCYEKVAVRRTHSVMDNVWMSKIISPKFLDRRGNPKFVVINEFVGTFYLSLLGTLLSSTLEDIVDATLHTCVESGIMQMLADQLAILCSYRMLVNNIQTDPIFAFSISDLQGAFYLLILGHSFAFTVSTWEVLIHFMSNTFYAFIIVNYFKCNGFNIV